MNAKAQVTGSAAATSGPLPEIPAAPEAPAASTDARPLRRDAERNRRLILGAAKTVFAQRGLDVSLDEVAKEAGLGVGTVYRRFPHRDALIDALFDDMVASIKLIADQALTAPRAWDGLAYFMTAMLETQAGDKGLRDAMIAQQNHLDKRGERKGRALRETVRPMLYTLVARAQQEGDLRADVVPTDIAVLLVTAVCMLEFTAPVAPDTWRRHLSVILDGLRARPAGGNAPLTEPPLGDEQVEACMAGWKYGTRETPRHRAEPS
ncbi:MAG TPA: TetR/AcrR family transcriptional regulator [Actinocrinis sp.]|nr:TetR/AcrR family transcriptional regulator [Actinocrinis sp.]